MADEEKAPATPAETGARPAKPDAKSGAKPGKADGKSPQAAKKGGPLKMILIVAGGLIVLSGVSLAVIFMVLVPKLKTAETSAREKPHASEASMGPVFEVKDLVINSADVDQLHYFKVGVAFEVKDVHVMEELQHMDPAIRDLLITELSRHTVQELNSNEGREALRKDLLEKLKPRVGKDALKSLFFTEYVAQ